MKKHFIFWGLPYFIGLIFVIVCLIAQVDTEIKGFEHLLGSMISFTSMIIGFYSAFFGILIAIKDTTVMKKIRGTKIEHELKYLLYTAVLAAFITLVLSMFLQVLQYYGGWLVFCIMYLWFFMVGVFGVLSFQTVLLSLELVFNNEPTKKGKINE